MGSIEGWDFERSRRIGDLLSYSRRRIARIVPMYYVVLVVSFLFGGWSADRLLAHLLFLRGDRVYWSIPQELLFYVLLPVLVLLLTRLFRRSDLAIAASLGGMAVAANLCLDVSVLRLDGNDTWLPFYFGVFASGMAFAYLYRWETLSRIVAEPRVNRVLHWIGITILLALFLTAPHYQHLVVEVFPRLPTDLAWTNPGLFGLLCGAFIWITLVCEGRLLHRMMSSLALRAIGLVSFVPAPHARKSAHARARRPSRDPELRVHHAGYLRPRREAMKPAVVGIGNGTTILDGREIEVDGNRGRIRILR